MQPKESHVRGTQLSLFWPVFTWPPFLIRDSGRSFPGHKDLSSWETGVDLGRRPVGRTEVRVKLGDSGDVVPGLRGDSRREW